MHKHTHTHTHTHTHCLSLTHTPTHSTCSLQLKAAQISAEDTTPLTDIDTEEDETRVSSGAIGLESESSMEKEAEVEDSMGIRLALDSQVGWNDHFFPI